MAPDYIQRLKASASLSTALTIYHARIESINADSLKIQLLSAQKKEWWQATADSLPLAVTCQL